MTATIYECAGCGRVTKKPDQDLETLQKAGHRSCCPERKMLALVPAAAVQPQPVDQDLQRLPCATDGYCVDIYPVRWKAYKPQGQKQMKRKGRWQRMNEYAGWDNCETPSEIWPDFPSAKASLSLQVAPEPAARAMLEALDAFMGGKELTREHQGLNKAVALAGSFAAAAYEAAPSGGADVHALTRSFLLALIDPACEELDYLRADPASGPRARAGGDA